MMRVGTKLRPGQRGTKALVRKYGDRLLCVRYRYDLRTARRVKTVELIIDEADWEPGPDVLVYVQVAYEERALRERLKQHGGRWHPRQRLWSLPYAMVKQLRLTHRIADTPNGVSNNGN